MNRKTKIMLHLRSLDQISGPNVSNIMIADSFLNQKFEFSFLQHKTHGGPFGTFQTINDLIKQIQKFNPDIVHISGLLRSGFEAVVASRLCGKKIVLTIHGSATDAINFRKKILYSNLIEPMTMRLSHKVYAVCEAMAKRNYVKKNCKARLIGTIHNSAPIIDRKQIQTFRLREKYNIGNDTVLIAIVGRMIYDKGVTYITEAIKKIKAENAVFVFIGDGPLLPKLTFELSVEIISRKVIILGKQTDVLSILKDCDIFLFATLHENLSNALLEACSMGLAVIATEVGGNSEVIRNEFNGILIPPANTERIVLAVDSLIENKSYREVLGRQAMKSIEENFSQKELLLKLEQVYTNLSS